MVDTLHRSATNLVVDTSAKTVISTVEDNSEKLTTADGFGEAGWRRSHGQRNKVWNDSSRGGISS